MFERTFKSIFFLFIIILLSSIAHSAYKREVYDYQGSNLREKVNYSILDATNFTGGSINLIGNATTVYYFGSALYLTDKGNTSQDIWNVINNNTFATFSDVYDYITANHTELIGYIGTNHSKALEHIRNNATAIQGDLDNFNTTVRGWILTNYTSLLLYADMHITTNFSIALKNGTAVHFAYVNMSRLNVTGNISASWFLGYVNSSSVINRPINCTAGSYQIGESSTHRFCVVDDDIRNGTDANFGYVNMTRLNVTGNKINTLNVGNSSQSHLYVDSNTGFVGIGTTAPERFLHINSRKNNIPIRLESTDANVYLAFADSNTVERPLIGAVTDDLLFSLDGEKVRITSTGNVGIGTTTPDAKLHIEGGGVHINGSGATLNVSNATHSHLYVDSTTGGVGIGTAEPVSGFKLDVRGPILASGGSNFSLGCGNISGATSNLCTLIDTGGSGIQNGTDANFAYVNLSRLNVTGGYNSSFDDDTLFIDTANNRVGIGTATPVRDFHVNSTKLVASLFESSSSTGLLVDYKSTANKDAAFRFQGTSDWTMGNDDSLGGAYIIAQANNYPSGIADASKHFVIKIGGNVGIGTTTPDAKLHIEGGGVHINGSGATLNVSNATHSHLYVDSNTGNVGIGTTNPTYKQTIETNTDGNNLNVSDTLYSEGTGIMGRVGIGTDNPSTTLEIMSPWLTGDDDYLRISDNLSGEVMSFGLIGWEPGITFLGSSSLRFRAVGDNSLEFTAQINPTSNIIFRARQNTLFVNSSAGEKVRFDMGTGNVGIGTTNPAHKLTVEGSVNVSNRLYANLSHAFGLATKIHTVATSGTWYNITMNSTHADATGFSFSADNITMIIPHEGHYTVTFGMGILDTAISPASHVAMRVVANEVEIPGSYVEIDTATQGADYWMEHTTHSTDLGADDEIRLQYISEDTSVTIDQHDTYATTPFTAYGYIQEIISSKR